MGLFGGGGSSTSTTKESGTSNTKTTTSAGSETGKDTLTQLLGSLQQMIGNAGEGYSKSDAINDSQTAADAAMTKVLRSGVGTVNASTTSGGAYDSTTQKLLSDNLAGEAAAASAEVTQNTISNYAQLSNMQSQLALSSMLSALGLDQSGETSSTQDTKYNKTTKTTTPKAGGGLGGLLSTGLSIAGGVVGGIYGGPLGASIGSSLGGAIGGAVSGGGSNSASGISGKDYAGGFGG